MLCENCRQNNASVHFSQQIKGKFFKKNLCEECINLTENNFLQKFIPFDLWENDFFKKMVVADGRSFEQEPKCSKCNLTLSDFNRTGKLGCNRCYATFRSSLGFLLERIHGSQHHIGKVPTRGNGVFRTEQQIRRLRQKLEACLTKEAYEKAAQIRDEIRVLLQNNNLNNKQEVNKHDT